MGASVSAEPGAPEGGGPAMTRSTAPSEATHQPESSAGKKAEGAAAPESVFRGHEHFCAWPVDAVRRALERWHELNTDTFNICPVVARPAAPLPEQRTGSWGASPNLSRKAFWEVFTDYEVIKDADGTFLALPIDVFNTFSRQQQDAMAAAVEETARKRRAAAGRRPSAATRLRGVLAKAGADGTVDARELLLVLALFCKGGPTEQLQLCFDIFDADGDKVMDLGEMFQFFKSLLGGCCRVGLIPKVPPDEEILRVATDAFSKADLDGGGDLSCQEWTVWAKGNLLAKNLLETFTTARKRVAKRRGGRSRTLMTLRRRTSGDQVASIDDDLRARVERAGTAYDACRKVLALLQRDKKFSIEHVKLLQWKFRNKAAAGGSGGGLSQEQFRELMTSEYSQLRGHERDVDGLFEAFDNDGSGDVSAKEFAIGLAKCMRGPIDDKLDLLFSVLDRDGDGTVSVEELMLFVADGRQEMEDITSYTEALTMTFDEDGDGQVSRTEFLGALERQPVLYQTFSHGMVKGVDQLKKPLRTQMKRTGTKIDLQHLRAVWEDRQEKVGDGEGLTLPAFRSFMVDAVGVPKSMLQVCNRLFIVLDEDRSGTVDLTELLKGLGQIFSDDSRDRADFYFQLYDLDGSGDISRDEVMHMLLAAQEATNNAAAKTSKLLRFLDIDGDGTVTRDEFRTATKRNPRLLEAFGRLFGVEDDTVDDEPPPEEVLTASIARKLRAVSPSQKLGEARKLQRKAAAHQKTAVVDMLKEHDPTTVEAVLTRLRKKQARHAPIRANTESPSPADDERAAADLIEKAEAGRVLAEVQRPNTADAATSSAGAGGPVDSSRTGAEGGDDSMPPEIATSAAQSYAARERERRRRELLAVPQPKTAAERHAQAMLDVNAVTIVQRLYMQNIKDSIKAKRDQLRGTVRRLEHAQVMKSISAPSLASPCVPAIHRAHGDENPLDRVGRRRDGRAAASARPRRASAKSSVPRLRTDAVPLGQRDALPLHRSLPTPGATRGGDQREVEAASSGSQDAKHVRFAPGDDPTHRFGESDVWVNPQQDAHDATDGDAIEPRYRSPYEAGYVAEIDEATRRRVRITLGHSTGQPRTLQPSLSRRGSLIDAMSADSMYLPLREAGGSELDGAHSSGSRLLERVEAFGNDPSGGLLRTPDRWSRPGPINNTGASSSRSPRRKRRSSRPESPSLTHRARSPTWDSSLHTRFLRQSGVIGSAPTGAGSTVGNAESQVPTVAPTAAAGPTDDHTGSPPATSIAEAVRRQRRTSASATFAPVVSPVLRTAVDGVADGFNSTGDTLGARGLHPAAVAHSSGRRAGRDAHAASGAYFVQTAPAAASRQLPETQPHRGDGRHRHRDGPLARLSERVWRSRPATREVASALGSASAWEVHAAGAAVRQARRKKAAWVRYV